MNSTIQTLLLAVMAVAARSQVIYVDASAAPPGTGSASSPYASIQTAVNAAGNGATIIAAPGIYHEVVNFIGKAITIRSAGNDPAATIIDGGGTGPVVTFASGEGQGSILKGFMVRNGIAPNGGGIFCSGASPRITDCVLLGNAATATGGGMAVSGGAPEVRSCTFTSNQAQSGGGIGLYTFSQAFVRDCTFSNNQADAGGGAWVSAMNGSIDNCTFAGNQAAFDGGAVFCSFGATTAIRRCAMTGNTAGFGGACTLTNTPALVEECRMIGNSAGTGGALVVSYGATPLIRSCVVAGNSAQYAGALQDYNSATRLVNCTVANNSATTGTGGVGGAASAGATIVNSILWANTGPVAGPIALTGGAVLSVSHSVVQGGWPGTGNIAGSPQFVNPANLDFHLAPGSPCVNNASSSPPDLGIRDFEGNPRNWQGNVDMGADEVVTTWAGTGEDLVLESRIAGLYPGIGTKPAFAGNPLELSVASPGGTFVGAIPIIVASGHPTGSPPPPNPGLPSVHVTIAAFVFLLDGTAPGPFGPQALPASNLTMGFTVPSGLAGVTIRVQAAVLSAFATNGTYAVSSAHDLVMM